MKHLIYSLMLMLSLGQCRPKEENTTIQFPGKPQVPSSIKKEHASLLQQMQQLTLLQDSTGHVALKLRELMQHHFKEEEDYVLPPLGLLPLLANGKLPEKSKEVIALTEKLKSQLSHMSAEHQLIVTYLNELKQAAAYDKHPAPGEFEKEIHQHASMEEEVLFPAAILVGEYLKIKSEGNQ